MFKFVAFGGVFQGSIFGVAGVLPKRYMQAIMSGQGMGGILPSLLSIISIAGKFIIIMPL